ncbi:MAG TPA: hypothetical protein VLR94_01660 [Acidobacteriota bacterium]|nr:hypothetical protein [Acidobacteriota bacterium]
MKTTLRKAILALAVLALGLPPMASADWRAFLPRSLRNGADLDVFGSYESDDNQVGEFGTKWTDVFLKEKVTLYSNGYVYDPKFMRVIKV